MTGLSPEAILALHDWLLNDAINAAALALVVLMFYLLFR